VRLRDRGVAIVLGVALLVRLAHLAGMAGSPTFSIPVMDAADYDDLARALLHGSPAGTPLFWQPVFYPVFLAAVYAVTGAAPIAAKLVQLVLGVVTVALTMRIAWRLGAGRTVALLAGSIVALYAPLFYFEGELLSAGWAALWCAVLLDAALALRADRAPKKLALFGGVAALATLTRPELLPCALAAMAWLLSRWWKEGVHGAPLGKLVGVAALGFAAVAFPAALASGAVTGRVALFPASGGLNLFIGNNPDWEKTVAARPGEEWARIAELPASRGVRGNMWVQQAAYLDTVRAYVAGEPDRFLDGLARKAVRFLSSRELPRELDLYVFRSWSWPLRLLVWKAGAFGFPWGVIFPLAVLGLASPALRGMRGLFAGVFGVYTLAVVLVFASARYRVPIVPAIAPLAALALIELVAKVRERKIGSLAIHGAAFVALAVAASLPGPFLEETRATDAELHRFVGNWHWHRGNLIESAAEFEKALARSPDDPVLLNEAGEVLVRLGRTEAAIDRYRRSLRARPEWAPTHSLLGTALLLVRDYRGAEAALSEAVRLDSTSVEALVNLGVARQSAGDFRGAIEAYERADRLRPDDAGILQNRGAAELASGNPEAAVLTLRRVLGLPGARPEARALLDLAEQAVRAPH